MAIMSLVRGVRNKSNTSAEKFSNNMDILMPIKGEVIPLEGVNDPAFSSGMLGKGCGVIPKDDMLYSPVNGRVLSIFPTKHALSIISDEGIEVLLHIGINTVKLRGEPFTAYVSDGDRVSAGTKLVRIDNKSIKQKNYDNTVIMVITNSDEYKDVVVDNVTNKGKMEPVMRIVK